MTTCLTEIELDVLKRGLRPITSAINKLESAIKEQNEPEAQKILREITIAAASLAKEAASLGVLRQKDVGKLEPDVLIEFDAIVAKILMLFS